MIQTKIYTMINTTISTSQASTVQPTLGSGIITADPTPFIAIAWGLSALILGGLVAYALLAARKAPLDKNHD